MKSFQSFDFVGNKDLNKKMFGNFAYDVNNLPTPQQKEQNMSKGMTTADWTQAGIGAVNALAGIGLGAGQIAIAEAERKAKEKQRQIENERYKEQKAYHEKGINDAANTASGLKSASANVSSQKPQQSPQANAPQANNPPQPTQEAQAQNPPQANTPPQEDLPMQRQ